MAFIGILAFPIGAAGDWLSPSPRPSPSPVPEPPLPFGAVIFRAGKVGSFETLGVAVIACRHRDPAPRRFAVQFFDPMRGGVQVTAFGPKVVEVPPGKKIVFVTDAEYFKNRDVTNMHVGHLGGGTARVISDARVVRCMGKMRFDPGPGRASRWTGTGMVRDGVGATPAPEPWR
jgi:hypothetical protein